MKIIEVRDGFIKFEADESIYLSSFVQADGTDKSYVAQVNQIRQIGQVRIANAKMLFVLCGEELQSYDKTEPSRDAELKEFPFSILQQYINVTKPVIVGKTMNDTQNVVVDSEVFNKKMLISVDNEELNNVLISNLSKQFDNLGVNSLIIDTAGIIKSKKFDAGKDFKLPLNTQTFEFMYKSCLNDATAQSKSMIAEIFNDLSAYSKTVPFVPFEALKAIVDDFVDKQHIFKLLVLKNKLAKFEQLGYFAANQREVQSLDNILGLKNAVIDLSRLDTQFKNYYLEYIYSHIDSEKTQVFVELSNTVSKKNLKNMISDSAVPAVLIANSHYQYLNDIKSMFDNFIIESTIRNKEIFKVYSSFLSSMERDNYLVVGEGVNYIPIVSKKQVIDEAIRYNPEELPIKSTVLEEIAEEKIENSEAEEKIENSEAEEKVENVELSKDENIPEKDEIIASIEEKSEQIIDSVSKELEEPQEMDLFDDTEQDDVSEDVEDASEDAEEVLEEVEDELPQEETDTLELLEETAEEEDIPQDEVNDIIEPEYNEVEELSQDLTDETAEQEVVLNEEEDDTTLAQLGDNSVEETEELQELPEIEEIQEESIALEPEMSDDSEETLTLSDLSDQENELTEELASDLPEDIEEISEVSDELVDIQETENYDEQGNSNEELSVELDNNDEILLQEIVSDDEEESAETEQIEPEADEISVIPVNEGEEFQSLDDLEELDLSETQDGDIVVDISDEEENITIDEDLDKQIVEDVDKVYTTMKEDSEELEEISDSDLDLIDELNSDNELEEYNETLEDTSGIDEGILEQPEEGIVPQSEHKEHEPEILEKKDMNTPIVPVYDADIPQEDMVVSDAIQQGDSVVHAKYGNGVVEKMIKYGTKTLYSINFENIGRRLLDPMLTEIKKL